MSFRVNQPVLRLAVGMMAVAAAGFPGGAWAQQQDDGPPGTVEATTEDMAEDIERAPGHAFVSAGLMQLSDNVSGEGGAFNLGVNGGYEWEFGPNGWRVFGDLTFKGDTPGIFQAGLGGNHYFGGRRNFGPFAGAEVGYGFAFPEGPADNEGGILLGAVGGVQLFEVAGLDMQLSARMTLMTDTVNDDVPFVYGVRLGALF